MKQSVLWHSLLLLSLLLCLPVMGQVRQISSAPTKITTAQSAPTHAGVVGDEVWQTNASAGQSHWVMVGDNSYGSAPHSQNARVWVNTGTGEYSFIADDYDYYVDSVNGLDTNDGRSKYTAWKTIAKLATATLASGDKIGFAADSVFEEQYAPTAANLTIGAYGTGERPMFRADSPITAASWTATGLGAYQATVSIAGAAGKTYVRAWETVAGAEVALTRAADLAACNSTAGTYFPSSDTASGNITLYVHLTADADPSGLPDGAVRYTARQFAIDAYNASAPTIRNINVRRNLHADGALRLGSSGAAWNVTASEGGVHNVYLRQGAYAFNLVADRAYHDSAQIIPIIVNEDVGTDGDVTCEQCSAILTSYTANTVGFYAHTNTSGSFGTLSCYNCTITNLDTAFSASNAASLLVDGGTISGGVTGVGVNVPLVTVRNVVSTTSSRFVSYDVAATVSLVSNVAHVTGSFAAVVFSTQASSVLTATNNTFYANGTAQTNGIQMTGAGSSLTATGNVWRNSFYEFYQLGTGYTLVSDDNDFSDGGSGNRMQLATVDYTLEAYKTATSQDANSTP